MDEERALAILIANACCVTSSIACDKCPLCGTEDCENLVFDDVLGEAVKTIVTKRSK